jgi:pimeloyl-ACP methyl ester carboxylesterase
MESRTPRWRLVIGAVIAVATAACTSGSSPAATAPATPSAPASASATASPAADRDFLRDIDVGGRTMSIACVGPTDTGRPTVVFETGLGGDKRGWADILTQLMTTDRGCSYDRAGVGLSEPGPQPRTTEDQVDDLHALLDAAGVEPPYVLVGHSSGGWNAMVFGDRFPNEVAGAVMVDVRPPLASERFAASLPSPSAGEPEAVKQMRADLTEWEHDPSQNPEGLDLIKSAAQAAASPGFGDRPLIVLTAGDRAAVTEGLPSDLAKTFDDIWMELQSKLVTLSTNGRQVVVAGATHDLPFEKPDVVVDAIHEVLGEIGG